MAELIKKRLGEILVDDGIITKEQLREALEHQKQSPQRKPLGETLIEMDYLTEEGLALSLSKKLGVKYVTFSDNSLDLRIDQDLEELIPEKFARENLILPVSKKNEYLTIAMWDPLNYITIDNIRKMTKMRLFIFSTTKMDIKIGIDKLYHFSGTESDEDGAQREKKEKAGFSDERDNIDELKSKAAEAPIIKMVNQIIRTAVSEKASDIHIDPQEDGVSVRYRTDGRLVEKPPLPKDAMAPIISRIKILSRLDISEKRLPQDGGFMMTIDKRSVDLRISTIPTIYGEKMCIRILDKEKMNINLATVGLNSEDYAVVEKAIKSPHGLICLTGPTGSGKTTSLYCILNEIKSPEKNILTIEDPVEYRIDTVNQVQAKPDIGLDFARGLRTFLRQDPDIIMVGEVRDLETAEICIRSALVGRLVLSTVHTNDSVGTIARLLDFGIEPFLLSSTLNMVIAQRLARKLCPQCKELLKLDTKTLDAYGFHDDKIFGPVGCKVCNDRGYIGRTAIFEIMCMDDTSRSMVERSEQLGVIKQYFVEEKGMRTLRDDGLKKVKQGITSLEEILTVTIDVK